MRGIDEGGFTGFERAVLRARAVGNRGGENETKRQRARTSIGARRFATMGVAFLFLAGAWLAVAPRAAGVEVPLSWTVDDDGAECPGAAFTSIQDAVDAAPVGQTILVCPGTYTEQVTIAKDGVTLLSQVRWAAVIKAPGTLAMPKAVVRVGGAVGVTIDGFTVTGPGSGGCHSIEYGIRVDSGGSATIANNHVTAIRDSPLGGCQNGVGILVGRQSEETAGTATILGNTIDDYQKGGIVISGPGSGATILNNAVLGHSAIPNIAQNGIQVSYGATATVQANTVQGNWYAGAGWTSSGILVFESDGVEVRGNTVSASQSGIVVESWCWASPSADGNAVEGNHVLGADWAVSIAAYAYVGYSGCNPTASGNRVSGNVIEGSSGEQGVFVGTATIGSFSDFFPSAVQNVVEKNDVVGFAEGVAVDAATGTSVAVNDIHGNDMGIVLGATATLATVDNNHVHENRYGIVVSGTQNTVINNKASDNRLVGIWARMGSSSNTIEMNKALHNVLDAYDQSRGRGTFGTANMWDKNVCDNGSPPGICREGVWSFYGDALLVEDGSGQAFQLRSDMSTSVPWGGARFTPPQPMKVRDIYELSADYEITAGGCGGGSPRFTLFIDLDGDGVFDSDDYQGMFINFGTPPYGGGCPLDVWQSTGNFVTLPDARVDVQNVMRTWSEFVTLYGTRAVWRVYLDVDSGWAFPPEYVQTVLVNNVRVNGFVLAA